MIATGVTIREQAMEKLLKFVDSRHVFPRQRDYDHEFTESEQYQLLRDLGVEEDLELFKTENPRSAIYAILNIEVLRYRRSLKSESKDCSKDIGDASWHRNSDKLFT